MGYESKAIVATRVKVADDLVLAMEVARIELSCAGDFKQIFDTPTDFPIYDLMPNADGDSTEVWEDDYGKRLTYAPISKVIAWLKEQLDSGEDFRRFKLLYQMLTALVTDDWEDVRDNLVVVHYGH